VRGFRATSGFNFLIERRIQISGRIDLKSSGSRDTRSTGCSGISRKRRRSDIGRFQVCCPSGSRGLSGNPPAICRCRALSTRPSLIRRADTLRRNKRHLSAVWFSELHVLLWDGPRDAQDAVDLNSLVVLVWARSLSAFLGISS